MADNTLQNGTDNIATDELATLNGVATVSPLPKAQRVKPGWGDDGVFRDTSQAFPLPVNIAASAGNIAPVTGSLTAVAASTVTGTASTTGTGVIDVSNAGNVSFHIASATAATGTVIFEMSLDPAGGTGTWAPVPVVPEDATSFASATWVLSLTAGIPRQFSTGMLGASLFRVRLVTLGTGTLSYLLKVGPGWIEGQPSLAPGNAQIGTVNAATAATGGTINTGAANTNTQLLAADANRKGCTVVNASNTATLSLAWGVATTTTYYAMRLAPGEGYEFGPEFCTLALNVQSTAATQPVNYNATT